ncbi:hypothetical protein EGM51_13920 [Verrucomicrobia bacterium S94]|nr:hypothetical protein EGM51_13920 [Verrucomicrobia bacterium S94]
MGIRIAAFIWGLAEATLFFIVPDVWLSYAGREKIKTGLHSCLFALIGALIGGLIMYQWGNRHPESAFRVLENIPAISRAQIESAGTEIRNNRSAAVMLAPLKGAPYKIYAVQAGHQAIPLSQFILITIPARLIRFMLVTAAIHYALKIFMSKKSARARQWAFCTGWTLFYAGYFCVMGL